MRSKYRWYLISYFLLFVLILHNNNILASEQITPDSSESPIRNYFNQQKILWTFDDYYICYDYPPHKGFTDLTEKIVSYGGHVNIMTILFHVNEVEEIRNYSVIYELDWDPLAINKSLTFFSHEQIYPACHGWDGRFDILNNASLQEAYNIINYTFWNWNNNFNIKPSFFLGASTSGNYNITVALKQFSNTNWPVYGENFRWDQPELFSPPKRDTPAVLYLGKEPYVSMFDPLFGLTWGNACKTLKEAQDLFINQTKNKEIIFIRGHPTALNNSEAYPAYKLWVEWIDWIYNNNELININHTDAIHYIVDRDLFQIEKKSSNEFIIDLSLCQHDHKMILSQPYEQSYNWTLYDGKKEITSIFNDATIKLYSGQVYQLKTNETVVIYSDTLQYQHISEEIPGFHLLYLFAAILLFSLQKKIRYNW